ncbi:MAG: hypothetical protein KUG65_05805 [Sphingomonadaceae bacterium]|nr:hypothetical protein [Sphingomonadaceae bacterium]
MNRDSALDNLAFAVGYRMMPPADRRILRISTLRDLGDAAPANPSLEQLEDEDRLIRGERDPVTIYDRHILRKAAEEAARPPFDNEFWRLRRTDLECAGFSAREAVDVIAAIRASLGDTTIGTNEGDTRAIIEQEAA